MVWNALTGRRVYSAEYTVGVIEMEVSGNLTALVIDTRSWLMDEAEVYGIVVLGMGGAKLFHGTSNSFVTSLSFVHGKLLSWVTYKGEVTLVDISSGETLSCVDLGGEGHWSMDLQECSSD